MVGRGFDRVAVGVFASLPASEGRREPEGGSPGVTSLMASDGRREPEAGAAGIASLRIPKGGREPEEGAGAADVAPLRGPEERREPPCPRHSKSSEDVRSDSLTAFLPPMFDLSIYVRSRRSLTF